MNKTPHSGESTESSSTESIQKTNPRVIENLTTQDNQAHDETKVSVKVIHRLESSGGDRTQESLGSEEESHSSWEPGTVIADKYEVIEKVGEGGFGAVYKVRHLQRKKLYALKTPHAEYLKDETFRRRFEREIQALERFVHPDVVTIRDSGTTEDGLPYYTMDFVEGESLRKVLSREGQLSLERAVHLARRILFVLEVAHENQVIHRDIKPDNILLTREGEREVVKLLDFGVVKLLDLVGKSISLTRGMRVGTPKYMSPEQVTGEEVDGRSDIFAVGILLYEMITGHHPFEVEGDPIRTTAKILKKQPQDPSELRSDVPPDLVEAIFTLLEKKPENRPLNARDARDVLPDLSVHSNRSTLLTTPAKLDTRGYRTKLTQLVLSRKIGAGFERNFLVFKNEVQLGRSDKNQKGQPIDLILRRLPCSSKSENPENWAANLTISQCVGSIGLAKNNLWIRPDEDSRFGIVVGGLRSREDVKVQSDRFHLSLGDQALEIEGYRSLRNKKRDAYDLSFITGLDEKDQLDQEGIGYSDPDCSVDYVRLTRGNNHPLHKYYLVFRRLTIGSGVSAGLRLPDELGILGNHATLIFDSGEVYLGSVDGQVVVERKDGSRIEVEPGILFPVSPDMKIQLGEVIFEVSDIDTEFFKRG